MSSLSHKSTITGMPPSTTTANLHRHATANPAFKPEFERSVRMHPVLAGVVGLVVLLLLLAYAARLKPTYTAESLVYIEPISSKVLPDGTTVGFDSMKYESSLAQQMLTAARLDIITSALKTLPHPVWAQYGATTGIAAANLQNQLKVARVATSYQVSISLKGSNPANTTAIVNAIVAAYLQAGRKDELTQADQRSQLLAEERNRISEELERTRREQNQLGNSLGIANPSGEGPNPYDSQLDALRSQLVTARTNHDIAAAQLAAISGVGGTHASGLSAAATDVINNDSGLAAMKSTVAQRRAILTTELAGLTPENPVYRQRQDELAELDKTLDSTTVQMRDRAARSLQDKLRTDLERTGDVESRINAQLAHQTASATGAAPRLQRAAELNADMQRLNLRFSTVDNALHSLELETTGPGMVHLALAATVPTGPDPDRRKIFLAAALPIAMLCALAAAVFARKRDRRIYTGHDADEVLGFAPIALIPARGEVSEHVLDEYYLRLAAGVETAYRVSNARTFVITAVSADTEIAPLVEALERKLIELGVTVAVIDAAAVFVPQAPVELSTDLALPAFERPFEGLAPSLFDRLKAEHDVVLIDATAVLYSAPAEYVARCTDVTLLVAESARTTRGELFQAGALLQRLNVAGVGCVLEQLQLRYADAGFRKAVQVLERNTSTVQRSPAPTAAPAARAGSEGAPATAPFWHLTDIAPREDAAAAASTHESTDAAERVDEELIVDEEPAVDEKTIPAFHKPLQTAETPRHAEAAASEPNVLEQEADLSAPLVSPVATEQPASPPMFKSKTAESAESEFQSLISNSRVPVPTGKNRQHEAARFTSDVTGASSTDEDLPRTESRSWFQRIFGRESEFAFSIVPDESEESHDSHPGLAHPVEDAVARSLQPQDAPFAADLKPETERVEHVEVLPKSDPPLARTAAGVDATQPDARQVERHEPLPPAPVAVAKLIPARAQPFHMLFSAEPAVDHHEDKPSNIEPEATPITHASKPQESSEPQEQEVAVTQASSEPQEVAGPAGPTVLEAPRPLTFSQLAELASSEPKANAQDPQPAPLEPQVAIPEPQIALQQPPAATHHDPQAMPLAADVVERKTNRNPEPPSDFDLTAPSHSLPAADQDLIPQQDRTQDVQRASVQGTVLQMPELPTSISEAKPDGPAAGETLTLPTPMLPRLLQEPEAALAFAAQAAPAEAAELKPAPHQEPSTADWNPESLTRWDPIPPLRGAEEPWRISRANRAAAAAGQTNAIRQHWGEESPVRIRSTDQRSAAQPQPENIVEPQDVVLTRRWGLLSRFQQGEAFQAARRTLPQGVETQPGVLAPDAPSDLADRYDRRRR